MLLVGATFLFADGNSKLSTVYSCSLFKVCSNGVDISSSTLPPYLMVARVEVASSLLLGIAGLVLLIVGLRGRTEKNNHTTINE